MDLKRLITKFPNGSEISGLQLLKESPLLKVSLIRTITSMKMENVLESLSLFYGRP